MRTDWVSTVLAGGFGCFGATATATATSVYPVMVATGIKRPSFLVISQNAERQKRGKRKRKGKGAVGCFGLDMDVQISVG